MSKETAEKKKHIWYMKWAASLILLVAMSVRASALSPLTDTILSFIGCAGWLYVSLAWADRALIILNAVACTILLTGILTQLQNAIF